MPKRQGLYRGFPDQITAGRTDANETPYIEIRFQIDMMEGPNGEWEYVEDFNRGVRLFMTEAARPYSLDTFERLGLDFDAVADRLEEAHEETGDMAVSAQQVSWSDEVEETGVQLRCTHDHRDGETYENWDIKTEYEREPDSVGNDVLKAARREWQTRKASQKKPEGKPSGPPPRASAGDSGEEASQESDRNPDYDSDISDDDIPGAEKSGDPDADHGEQTEEVGEDVPEDEIPF